MCIFCSYEICGACDVGPAGGAIASEAEVYRFSRKDFAPLSFVPLHYDLDLDFDSRITSDQTTTVTVTSMQTYRRHRDGSTSTISLNAHNLEILSVQYMDGHVALGPPPEPNAKVLPDFVGHIADVNSKEESFVDAVYVYEKDERKLNITLPSVADVGDEIVLKIVSKCFPNERELEGIYFDFTPPGKPQTMISQCQQYGFQRIVPCIDMMTSKTFYTTRITASKDYTNIVTNGDLQEKKAAAGDKMTALYYNHKVNMAPYLFFVAVGTYETYKSEVEYPDGKKFDIELLALPGVLDSPKNAEASLKALNDSIVWTCVNTGREKYAHEKEREQIWKLLAERDELKKSGADPAKLDSIRESLKQLISHWGETGYSYTGTCYREIGMENSNYGGMENVGNTTIVSSMLTPSRWIIDARHIYMEGVKAHEFYHNINGSQVTGDTPFEIWLNEAVTVHVQREREIAIFGHDSMRLQNVIYARTPGSGPLAMDRSPASMAIEPVGFNTTQELITAMTYSKSPEFVRMVQLIIGKENFVKALADYHSKYSFGNATSSQWVDCMAKYNTNAEVDFKRFSDSWLRRTGYPTVTVNSLTMEDGALKIELNQTGFEDKSDDNQPWVIPVAWSTVKDGKKTQEGLFILNTASKSISIENVDASNYDFISLACDWSFYGELIDNGSTSEQKFKQAMTDPDTVNRFLAYQSILDKEKAKLVEACLCGCEDLISVSDEVIQLYGSVLDDRTLQDNTKGTFLRITEPCPSRSDLSHYYGHLKKAKKILTSAISAVYLKKAMTEFKELALDSTLITRPLKFALYQLIKCSDDVSREEKITLVQPLLSAESMSDKAFAFVEMLEFGGEEGKNAQAMIKADWTSHPIGTEQYISCIGIADCDGKEANVRQLMKESFFKLSLSGHGRGISRAWCSDLHRALLTPKGLELTKEIFLNVGRVNQMSAYGFLSSLSEAHKMPASIREVLKAAVIEIKDGLDSKEQESLFNQLTRLIAGFD